MEVPLAHKSFDDDADDFDIEAEQEPLFDRLMERMGDFLDECIDQEVFTELEPSIILEMTSYIKEFESEN